MKIKIIYHWMILVGGNKMSNDFTERELRWIRDDIHYWINTIPMPAIVHSIYNKLNFLLENYKNEYIDNCEHHWSLSKGKCLKCNEILETYIVKHKGAILQYYIKYDSDYE